MNTLTPPFRLLPRGAAFLIALATFLPVACGPAATPTPPTATPFPLASRAVNYTYDGAGRLVDAEYDNGAIIAYEYDNAGNLLSREVTAPGGSSPSATIGAARPLPPAAAWPVALLTAGVGVLIVLRQRMVERINEYVRQSHSFIRCAKQFVDTRLLPRGAAFRLTLALSLLLGALGLTTGAAYANEGVTCQNGRPLVYIQGFTPFIGVPVKVSANGLPVGTMTPDANGNASLSFGQSNVLYDVSIHLPDGSIPLGSVNCPPPGPVGSQGQSNTGSYNTTGNSGGNSGKTGDPVSTSIGEYSFSIPLLDLGGPLPIQFTLNYAASMDKSPAFHNDPFGGDNFSHNFHAALKRTDDATAVVFLGNGNLITFQKAGGRWQVAEEEIIFQLQEDDGRYFLLDPISELLYTFQKKTVSGAKVGQLIRVEDRSGNALTFTNDRDGRVTRVEDGLGRALDFTYENPADDWTWPHLVGVADQTGRAIQFGYQIETEDVSTIHLTSVADALGNTTTFTHFGPVTDTVVSALTLPLGNTPYTQTYEQTAEGLWRVTAQTDAYGNTTAITFNGDGTTTMTDPLGNTSQHTHDGAQLTDVSDTTGEAAALGYDDAGRRNSITDRLGGVTTFTYHPETGNIASVTNAKGDTIAYTYAAQEQTIGEAKFTFYNLTQIDYPDKTSAKFEYDATGNVIAYTDQAAQVWKIAYTPAGLPTTLTNPLGGVVTYTYNPDQTLASRKDSETGETRFTYDAFKRVITITYADGSEVGFTYDANDRLLTLTDADKGVAQFEYDANGNLIKTTDAAGKETTYAYDEMDRLIQETDRLGQSTSLAYDRLGRIESVADATGVLTQFAYDPRGWLNQIKLGESVWKYGYDDEGVVNALVSPSGNTTTIQSDELGFAAGATNALDQTSTLTRDAANRVTAVTDPLGRETAYTYDARGALNGVTAPVVGSSQYDYDAAGNLTQITDLNGAEWKFTYSPMGRLLTQTDPLGSVTQYQYDERGRLSLVTYPDNTTRAIAYDALGNIARVTFSDQSEKIFVYDALGRLIEADGVIFTRDAEGRITNTQLQTSNSQLPTSDFGATYDNAGRVETVAYNNGAFTVTYVYDEKTGLLKQVTDSLTQTQIDFTYDEDLRLTNITRSNKVNTTLTWDNANRLIGLEDGEVSDLQYTLDAAGQVTQMSGKLPLDPAANIQPQTSNFQYDQASQVGADGYEYDAQGRLTASPTNNFSWDADSQLAGIDSVKLSYNGLGEVISREEDGKVTRLAYNYALGLAPIVAEYTNPKGLGDPSGLAPTRYYVWTPGGALLYAIDASDDNKVSHYHFDRTGSTLALTDADGKMTDAYAYDPYGKVLKHDGKNTQPFTFVGKWGVRQESATLYQVRARYYDATTARLISRDPTFPGTDTRLLNPYLYALNDPVGTIDITGREPQKVGFTPAEYARFLDELRALNEMISPEGPPAVSWGVVEEFGKPSPQFYFDAKLMGRREIAVKLSAFMQKWNHIFFGVQPDERALQRQALLEWLIAYASREQKEAAVQEHIRDYERLVDLQQKLLDRLAPDIERAREERAQISDQPGILPQSYWVRWNELGFQLDWIDALLQNAANVVNSFQSMDISLEEALRDMENLTNRASPEEMRQIAEQGIFYVPKR